MNTRMKTGRNRRQREGGLMRALLAAFLLAVLLTPVMSRTAGAEETGEIEPVVLQEEPLLAEPLIAGEVVDLPVDELTPSPEPVTPTPDLNDVIGLPEEPEVYDPSNEINDIYVNPVYCPYDLDLYSADYFGLAAACGGLGHPDGYELIIRDSGFDWWLRTTIAGSGAGQTGLPNDTYYVAMSTPLGGTSSMRYICSAADLLGNDAVASFDVPDEGFGAFIAISGGLMWYCDIFINQEPPALPTIDVTINKHGCPAGITSTDMYELAAACHEMLTGIEFRLTDGYGSVSTQTTAGAPAIASFSQVRGGQLSIEETIPAGYGEPIAFCKVEDMLGANLGVTQAPAVSGGLFAVDALAGEAAYVFCDVYNFPEHSEGGHVTIHKWECSSEIAYGQDVSYYLTECAQPTANIEFAHGEVGELAELVSTSANGDISFAVDSGSDWAIEEHVPSGYGDPIVFCRWGAYSTDFLGNPFSLHGFANLDGSQGARIEFSTYESLGMDCNWFNVPEQYDWDGGDLTIYKYWCSGYVVSESACVLGSGVKFVVTAVGGGGTILTETGADGYAAMSGLAAGAYQIVEKDFVWCKAVSSKVDGAGNVVIEAGQETVLTVYNCGAEESPVTKLPNTGVGDLWPGTDDELIILGGLAVLAQAILLIALRGKGVTLQCAAARIRR